MDDQLFIGGTVIAPPGWVAAAPQLTHDAPTYFPDDDAFRITGGTKTYGDQTDATFWASLSTQLPIYRLVLRLKVYLLAYGYGSELPYTTFHLPQMSGRTWGLASDIASGNQPGHRPGVPYYAGSFGYVGSQLEVSFNPDCLPETTPMDENGYYTPPVVVFDGPVAYVDLLPHAILFPSATPVMGVSNVGMHPISHVGIAGWPARWEMSFQAGLP